MFLDIPQRYLSCMNQYCPAKPMKLSVPIDCSLRINSKSDKVLFEEKTVADKFFYIINPTNVRKTIFGTECSVY